MLRSSLLCGAAALALLVPSVRADEGVPIQKTLEQQQKDILNKLTQIQNDLASLKEQVNRIDTAKASTLDANDLKAKLDELHADFLKLQNQVNSDQRSISGFQRMPQ